MIEMIEDPGAPFDVDESNATSAAASSEAPKSAADVGTALAIKTVQGTVSTFDKVEAGLQALESKYAKVVYPVTTTAGMDEAKKARLEIRNARYAVQNAVEGAKKPLEQMKKTIAARGAEIIERLTPLEEHVNQQITAEETRKEADKAKREQEEREKRAEIEEAIRALREAPMHCLGQTSAEIQVVLDSLKVEEITPVEFGDRAGEALQILNKTLETLETMVASTKALEDQRAELEAMATQQREANEKAQREQAERDAAQKKADDERIAAQQAEDDARAAKQAAQDKANTATQDMHAIVSGAVGKPLDVIVDALDDLSGMDISEESHGIHAAAVGAVWKANMATLTAMRDTQVAADAAAETARLAQKEIDDAEAIRVAARIAIRDEIAAIGRDDLASVSTAAQASAAIERLSAMVLADEHFGELVPEAVNRVNLVVEELTRLHGKFAKREQDERDAAARKKLNDHSPQMLSALRVAVVALASASKTEPAYADAYQRVSDTITLVTGETTHD